MKREMSKARQVLVDSYIESLEKEIIPWKQGWSTVKNYNPVTKTQYRGINRLILYNAVAKNNYNDPRWMTFSQIKAANYKLNNAKGKGVPLEKCSLYDMETKKYLNISDVDKIVREENLSRQEKYERFKWSVKVFYVFNASLIEGIEPYTIEEKDIHIDVNDLACRFIDRYCKNANLSIVENFLCECPVYKPVNDMILIPAKGSFDDEYEFVSAVLHECCHSTMKENRLGRSYPNLKTNNERYAFEELYAEIASSFLCADIGIEIKQDKAVRQDCIFGACSQCEQLVLNHSSGDFLTVGQTEYYSNNIQFFPLYFPQRMIPESFFRQFPSLSSKSEYSYLFLIQYSFEK